MLVMNVMLVCHVCDYGWMVYYVAHIVKSIFYVRPHARVKPTNDMKTLNGFPPFPT